MHRDKENGGCQGNGELVFNEYRVSIEDDEKVWGMDGGDGSQQCEHI